MRFVMLLPAPFRTKNAGFEAKELIAGYTLIQVKSPEEALEWSKRFPNPVTEGVDAEIEVRRLFDWDDFEAVESFKDLTGSKK